MGRLSGIYAPNGDYVAFRYDAGGRLTDKWLPNGTSASYTYNADSNLASVVNWMSTGYASAHTYEYDGFGNRRTVTDVGLLSQDYYRYAYDELDRLKEVRDNATNALIEGYTYDPLGNRKTKTDSAGTTY